MNRAIAAVKQGLQAFVDQRDDFVQVIHALDTEFAIILSALKAVEDETPSDVFMQFAVPCTGLDAYLETIFVRVEACLAEADKIRDDDGEERLPGLPAACRDASVHVVGRLRAMMEHVRALAGDPLDRHVVFAFLPLEIHDRAAYATIVSGLLPRAGHEPWMRGIRVIVRDDAAVPFLVPHLAREGIEDVRVLEADLSFSALASAIAEETGDPSAPMLQRVLGLIQLAGIDIAYKQLPQAASRFRAAYQYFAAQGSVPYSALCLHGMGLAAERGGMHDRAKSIYQQGLAVAAPDMLALPISLVLTTSLGDVCHVLRQLDEALGYYDLADQVAGKLTNLSAKIDIMTKQGDVHRDAGDVAQALARWIAAAGLCKEFQMFHQWRDLLARQHATCKRAGMHERLRAVEAERDLMAELERRSAA